jgi:hypothetical protein
MEFVGRGGGLVVYVCAVRFKTEILTPANLFLVFVSTWISVWDYVVRRLMPICGLRRNLVPSSSWCDRRLFLGKSALRRFLVYAIWFLESRHFWPFRPPSIILKGIHFCTLSIYTVLGQLTPPVPAVVEWVTPFLSRVFPRVYKVCSARQFFFDISIYFQLYSVRIVLGKTVLIEGFCNVVCSAMASYHLQLQFLKCSGQLPSSAAASVM